ncbi:MAG: hypothetical protein HXY34_12435 [Candidatus Thorarchaeota archaeon]|nr:hypothetical protein [Candidatus Thorarchaeota archaeon]
MMPSARTLLDEILSRNPDIDINALHSEMWASMKRHRKDYLREQVDAFLKTLRISESAKAIVREALLQPVTIDGVEYDSFIIGISRKISQSIQPLSGKSSELCAEVALSRAGLKRDVHYRVRDKRSDITLYHPTIQSSICVHRIEIKNLKIRERATRGLVFDGDSMFGFFDDPGEFTEGNIEELQKAVAKTGGYVYLPPETLSELRRRYEDLPSFLRPNTRFGTDMASFVKSGTIPAT